MAGPPPVYVQGLTEFRNALKQVSSAAPRELAKGIKAAGEPLKQGAAAKVPRRTGQLAGGYAIQVRATTGAVINKVAYAGGAEWGRRGKWAGFDRYGAAPRFAGAVLQDRAGEIQDALTRELDEILTIMGWAH